MTRERYSRFQGGNLILRDELAIDRTFLSNERTLLAYLRSGVALLIAGATMMHFSQEGWFLMIGIICLPIGVISAGVGILRYRRMNAALQHILLHNGSFLDEPKQKRP